MVRIIRINSTKALKPGLLKPYSEKEFEAFARRKWQEKVRHGVVRYNPTHLQKQLVEPYTVYFIPQRTARKKPVLKPPVTRPHGSDGCLFDRPDILERDTIAKMQIDDHHYHLMVNIFPLLPEHFLIVRNSNLNSELSQHIQSSTDLLHLLLMQRLSFCRYDFLFSSNPGKKSSAGASLNHWHAHAFSFAAPVRELLIIEPPLFEREGITLGQISWPAQLRVFQGDDLAALSRYAFIYIDLLNQRNLAYNLVITGNPSSSPRLLVIPRGKTKPKTKYEISRTAWAGIPHCGTIFERSPRAFTALRRDLRNAKEIITRQLEETTLPAGEMAELDRSFKKRVSR